MTIISAAFRSADDYAMSADTAGVFDGQRVRNTKIHRIGRCILGACGSLAQHQRALNWLLETEWSDENPTRIATTFRALYAHLLEHEGPQHPGGLPTTQTSFLLVGPHGIVAMDLAGAIVWHDDYFAIGAGADFALGAMWNMKALQKPSDRADTGVYAALHWSSDCFGGLYTLTQEP